MSNKTSLIVSVPNRPGAAYTLLALLAEQQVSMTKFELRPAPSEEPYHLNIGARKRFKPEETEVSKFTGSDKIKNRLIKFDFVTNHAWLGEGIRNFVSTF